MGTLGARWESLESKVMNGVILNVITHLASLLIQLIPSRLEKTIECRREQKKAN